MQGPAAGSRGLPAHSQQSSSALDKICIPRCMQSDGLRALQIIAHLDAETAYCKAALADTEALQEQLYTEMRGRIQVRMHSRLFILAVVHPDIKDADALHMCTISYLHAYP